MCALEKRSLTCIEKIWQADHAPGGFPTLHTHTISYTIFLYVHTYISKIVRESTSNCLFPAHRIVFVRLRFLIFLWVYPASGRCAKYHANYLFEFRLFCLPFLRSFCLSFFFSIANRNIRLKFHMTWLIRELCSTSFKVVDGVKELRIHKETAEGHKIHIIATLVDLERPN